MLLNNNFELNENVLYLAETLKQIQISNPLLNLEELSDANDKLLFDSVRNRICLAIKICLRAHESVLFGQEIAKFEIFSYFLSKYFTNKTIVPSPNLSFDLILSLAVENRVSDFGRVKIIYLKEKCLIKITLKEKKTFLIK